MAAQEVCLVATESSCLFPTDCFPLFFKENIAANGNDNTGIVGEEFSPLSFFFVEMFRLISIQISYFPRQSGKKWEEIR